MALTPDQVSALDDRALNDKIAEEASELIKAVMKLNRFGPRPFAGGVQYNNVCDANDEFGELDELMLEFRRRHGRS